jgi:hypothetical protein
VIPIVFVVTQNETLHRFPALEQCNLDDARIEGEYTELPVSRAGTVVPPGKPCKHCRPLDPDFVPRPRVR